MNSWQPHPLTAAERDQVRHRTHRRSRKPQLDQAPYRARNIAERVIGWIKRLPRIAARVEKLAVRYAGLTSLALIARAPPMFCQILP